MFNSDFSQFKFYSFGIAAANKDIHDPMLAVTPIEATQFFDGELQHYFDTEESSGVDANGDAYQTSVTVSTSIPCIWLPFNSNRLYAPDIRRGERVFIFTYADTGVYYWTATGWDDNLRRLETVVHRYSATKEEYAELDDDNTYGIEISTHKQLITLKTSKANGEYCVYNLQFNLKDGNVVLTDDLGNFINLDSQNTNIHIENAEQSRVELARTEIYVESEKLIHGKSKSIILECEDYTLKASKSITEETKSRSLKASTNKIEASTSHQGDVQLNGDLTHSGDYNLNGGLTANGGSFTHNGKDVGSTHKHPSGTPLTGTPV